jgi:very-short-patch-repair endonuclease
MNEIEQKFYDAFLALGESTFDILPQEPVGIYVADFVIFPTYYIPSIVEIDGHDWHKTKEQRFYDYMRERFFIRSGYSIIRFMGSEVFVDAAKCAKEAVELSWCFREILLDVFSDGLDRGLETARETDEDNQCQTQDT